jgi:hypothetical protein
LLTQSIDVASDGQAHLGDGGGLELDGVGVVVEDRFVDRVDGHVLGRAPLTATDAEVVGAAVAAGVVGLHLAGPSGKPKLVHLIGERHEAHVAGGVAVERHPHKLGLLRVQLAH